MDFAIYKHSVTKLIKLFGLIDNNYNWWKKIVDGSSESELDSFFLQYSFLDYLDYQITIRMYDAINDFPENLKDKSGEDWQKIDMKKLDKTRHHRLIMYRKQYYDYIINSLNSSN